MRRGKQLIKLEKTVPEPHESCIATPREKQQMILLLPHEVTKRPVLSWSASTTYFVVAPKPPVRQDLQIPKLLPTNWMKLQ